MHGASLQMRCRFSIELLKKMLAGKMEEEKKPKKNNATPLLCGRNQCCNKDFLSF